MAGRSLEDKRWKLMQDAEFRREYDRLEDEFSLARQLIRARVSAGLSQDELAKRMNTSQPAIARLESGKAKPSLSTLNKFADATNSRLTIQLTPAC